jgi:hypothetical protein
MRPPREDTKAWYQQFWPWFLIALPGTAVVAGFITLGLAINDSDSLVRDNYYKEGLAINRDMARERMAADLGVRLTVAYDPSTGRFTARMNDAPVGNLDHLALTLTHPTLAEQDRKLRLEKSATGFFESDAAPDVAGANWHVTVSPPGETWKLSDRWDPQQQPALALP